MLVKILLISIRTYNEKSRVTVVKIYLIFRKDFEKQIEEREMIEELERVKYRRNLDDKVDQQNEKLKKFYIMKVFWCFSLLER